MRKLLALFDFTHPTRCFARLDSQGCCQAFKQCRQPPVGEHWVEIEEVRLNWLHQVLPNSARLAPRSSVPCVQPLLNL